MSGELKNVGYPFVRTQKGKLNPISDVLKNAQSKLLNLINTNKGQRILSNNCQFGIDINRLLFQNINYPNFQKIIQEKIKQQVDLWIPQISDIIVKITKEQNAIILKIDFSVNQQQYSSVNVEIENE